MVEANATTDAHGQPHGILKHDHSSQSRHVQFDEQEIAAYDAQRGRCMPIDDPKTPFHEENDSDEDMRDGEEEKVEIDPELAAHLNEAKQNLVANSVCTSGVQRIQKPGDGQAQAQSLGGIDPTALASRL